MWELDHKAGRALKNWCFWTLVLEKTLKSPLDSMEIKPVNSKENQPWIFIGRTAAEALIFGHLMRRTDSLEKILMVGKFEGRRRSGWQRMRWLDGIIDSMDMSLSNPKNCSTPVFPSPSLSPGVCPNSCPFSQWCHPTILSSVTHFSSCPQFFPASGSIQGSQYFPSGGQNIWASASVLPKNIQG